MTSEDAEIARNVRRELSKRPLDSTMIDIQVKAGKVTLAGRVLHMSNERGVNLRSEIEHVIKAISRERIVKGVFDQMHYVIDHSEGEDKEKDPRGRMRSH